MTPGKIHIVAVCAGAGGSVVKNDACAADTYFTGEMRHHEVLDAVQRGKVVILAGHTQTERSYLPVYRRRLTRACGLVQWIVSRSDRPPSKIV
jgi:putative NIF3 family GTP cyclohydrolase 1 type 2